MEKTAVETIKENLEFLEKHNVIGIAAFIDNNNPCNFWYKTFEHENNSAVIKCAEEGIIKIMKNNKFHSKGINLMLERYEQNCAHYNLPESNNNTIISENNTTEDVLNTELGKIIKDSIIQKTAELGNLDFQALILLKSNNKINYIYTGDIRRLFVALSCVILPELFSKYNVSKEETVRFEKEIKSATIAQNKMMS